MTQIESVAAPREIKFTDRKPGQLNKRFGCIRPTAEEHNSRDGTLIKYSWKTSAGPNNKGPASPKYDRGRK